MIRTDWPTLTVLCVVLYAHGLVVGAVWRSRYLRAHGREAPPCQHPEWLTIGPGEWVCTNLACRKRRSGGYPK